MKKIDLQPGTRFGKLTVIEESEKRSKTGDVFYLCQCDCGTEKEIAKRCLRSGDSRSCGCRGLEKISIGGRYDKLTVMEFVGSDKGHRMYLCKCDCGKYATVRASNLRSKYTGSCGCKGSEDKRQYLKSGEEFGRLTVVGLSRRGFPYYTVKCSCGKFSVVNKNSLRSGNSRSCGCAQREAIRLEGLKNRKRAFGVSRRQYELEQKCKGRMNLSDSYIKNILSSNCCLSTKDIPPGLVALKRLELKGKRMIREMRNEG